MKKETIDLELIYKAIEEDDSDLLNTVGADYYKEEEYELAKIYYELAIAMGNDIAMSNLGYIYMYGRGVPIDYSIAIAYFKIAAEKGNIEATYKLGKLYQSGNGVEKNTELALKYYDESLRLIEAEGINRLEYPSVYFALAKEMLPEGSKKTNLKTAYEYLKTAVEGYKHMIDSYNANYYSDVLEEAESLLKDKMFDELLS